MANEWVKRDRNTSTGDTIHDFIIADGTGVEKGTLMYLSGDRTVSAHSAANQPIIGVLAREKIVNDGRTQIAVDQGGVWDATCSGAVVLGSPVMSAGEANMVKQATTTSGGFAFGRALEAGTSGETIQIQLF